MATEGELVGLFIGADHIVEYRDSDNPPTNMLGWATVLDFRKKDTSSATLKAVSGTVSGVHNADAALNEQKISFPLTDDDLAATIFTGDDPAVRYSIKRVDAGAEQPLRYGDATLIRVTQV